MTRFSHFFLSLVCVFFIASCLIADDLEKEALESKSAEAGRVQYDEEDVDKDLDDPETGDETDTEEDVDDTGEFDDTEEDLETDQVEDEDDTGKPADIQKVTILSVSEDSVRDGFKAEVETVNVKEDVEFGYVWKLNGEELPDENERILPWNDEFKKGDTLEVLVTPAGGDQEYAIVPEGAFIIPNSPPQIVSTPPLEVKDGKLFKYQVEAQDPDGDTIEFLLKNAPKGMVIEPAIGLITWDFTEQNPGSEYRIEIVISDEEGLKYTQKLTLTIPEQQPVDDTETQ